MALSGDYDFQFMIEELAVGAQHKLPYLHVVVNNSYLGLIRQSQRGFQMDFEVSLAFDNINSDEVEGYGVDHVAVAEGLGCKAVRVKSPNEFKEAFATAKQLMAEHQVPVVLEFILERVTNISMGTDLHNVSEFEEILCLDPSLRIDQVSGSVLRGCRGRGGAGALTLRRRVAVERAARQALQMVQQTVGAGGSGVRVAVDDRRQGRGVDLRALGEARRWPRSGRTRTGATGRGSRRWWRRAPNCGRPALRSRGSCGWPADSGPASAGGGGGPDLLGEAAHLGPLLVGGARGGEPDDEVLERAAHLEQLELLERRRSVRPGRRAAGGSRHSPRTSGAAAPRGSACGRSPAARSAGSRRSSIRAAAAA